MSRTWEPAASMDPLVHQACALIEGWVGMTLSGAAPQRLREFLVRRAHALGFSDISTYLRDLERSGIDAPEPRRLINLITNGLTAFWRDAPQLDALRLAMIDIGATRDLRMAPLAIWCAGCSTGEEPYTISMIAREAGLPAIILGTDINTDVLDRARQGDFDVWSLRRLSHERRRLYFTHHPTNRDVWRVHDLLRERVYFRRHNIMEPAPSAPNPSGWDIILCRNVLIYFRERSVRRALQSFADGLQPGGYLMLGSSEQLMHHDQRSPFRASRHGRGFVYRLGSTPPGHTLMNIRLPQELLDGTRNPTDIPEADAAPTIHPPRPRTLEEETIDMNTREAVSSLLDMSVEHLARRDRKSALACCEAAVGYDPFVPETHFLMGSLLRDGGAPDSASEEWRKTLFLHPMHWLAAYELAQQHEQRRDPARARLSYRQALEGLKADEPLFPTRSLQELFEHAEIHKASIEQACRLALERLNASAR